MKFKLLYILLLGMTLTSCIKLPELINFTEGADFDQLPTSITNLPPLKIQTDDLLSIRVGALDLVAAEPFNIDPPNMNINNIGGGGGIRPLIGYLVNIEGELDFPILGKIQAAGLSTDELKAIIIEKLQPYLKDPVVVIRYLNFRITVLGEVFNPSTFFMSNERVTLLDALGQAGDLSPYANRTNILIIREQNGERSFGRINLQNRHLFESPYFYLQQNDVIYVEPLSEKTASLRDQSQRILPWLSVITSLTTLALTLASLK